MKKNKPIETEYKGYRFRSRLEARWAVFFETLGCGWEYEPEGFNLNGLYYLPDFKVSYPNGSVAWFEVKPSISSLSKDEVRKISMFAKNVDDIYLLDGTPELGAYKCFPKYTQGVERDCFYDNRMDETIPLTDKEVIEMNVISLNNASESPKNRWGDALYTHEDMGRIFVAVFGGDIREDWEPLLTEAVYKARSARFEHRSKRGR